MKRMILSMALIFYSDIFSSGTTPSMDVIRSKSVLIDNVKETWLLDADVFQALTDVERAQACRFAYHNEKLRTALPKIIKQITSHTLLVKLSLILSQLYNGDDDEWKYYCLMEDVCRVQEALQGDEYAIGYLSARNKKAESILKNYDKAFDQDGLLFDLLVKLLRSSRQKKTAQTKNHVRTKTLDERKRKEPIGSIDTEKLSYKKARLADA